MHFFVESDDDDSIKRRLATFRREQERQKPSPGSQAIRSNRLSFFDNPTEPVRIDPWSFLGLKDKPPATSSPKGESPEEAEHEAQEEEVMEEEAKVITHPRSHILPGRYCLTG